MVCVFFECILLPLYYQAKGLMNASLTTLVAALFDLFIVIKLAPCYFSVFKFFLCRKMCVFSSDGG